MALAGGVSDDLITPSVAFDDGLDEADALILAGAIGVGEEREPSQRAVGARRRVALVAEWHPEPGAQARSQAAEPGLARSKSIRATAQPPSKTTLSRFGSLCETSPCLNRSGIGCGQL